jgi:hypothetical protein
MSTATSLNLRAVLKTAVARSGMDVPAHVVSGLTAPAKALFVAAAAQARPHEVVLYVVPSDADLEEAVADVSFFSARSKDSLPPQPRARSCRFRLTKSIRIEGWRRTSA